MNSRRIARLIARVGDVERVEAGRPDPDVDEVDDIAEAQAVEHVADRAAEQQARA